MAHLAARIWPGSHCWRFATAMEASLAGATGELWDVGACGVVVRLLRECRRARDHQRRCESSASETFLGRQLMRQCGIFLEMFVRCT
jgi:hypothetical protein